MNAATSYKLSAMPRLLRLATTLTAVGFAVAAWDMPSTSS
jgi:hypothetical protein